MKCRGRSRIMTVSHQVPEQFREDRFDSANFEDESLITPPNYNIFNYNIGEPMHYDTTREWLVDQHIDDWDKKIQESLWYVADDSGITMLDNVDFETANKYAYNHHGCNAYMKTN